ncbi:MAG TPA: DUF2628 domain-containing protein [Paracoccaceae bacterium]|nr:DUF2628 domain-containing protein [Paracoccaceae bacterium]
MEANLYTIHRKGEQGLCIVGDGFDTLALLLAPVWIVWQGLWLTGAALVVVLVAAAAVSPVAVFPVMSGVGFVFAFEGASVIRAELRLRGWREAGIVEARSEAGAEELYLTGQAA